MELATPVVSREPGAIAATTPLVTIIVRSMGRPELRGALESIARQDYPAIETIIVDATGGGHPPLPAIEWRAGHRVRRIGAPRRLPRPQAANAGLQAASGEWCTFLDDDDTCDPHHISALVGEAARHPGALLVYGQTRWLDADGRTERLFGQPFNRLLVHFGPLFCWQAALIHSRVVELGCRFDEAFDVLEDRDFIAQVARHGDPILVPVVAFNFRPDLGTSGTGAGANWNPAQTVYYDQLLRAKWAGARTFHAERSTLLSLRAVRAFEAGDREGAQQLFRHALAEYPDDPNALHGLARVALESGDLATAENRARQAIDVNTHPAEYHLTLAEILARSGGLDEAAAEAARAAEEPALQERAAALLRTLPAPVPPGRSRTQPCPCGSGLRYKACCGRFVVATTETESRELASAVDALRRGDAQQAFRNVAQVACDEHAGAGNWRAAAAIALQLGAPEHAVHLLAQVLRLRDEPATRSMLADGCRLMFDAQRSDSLWDTAREVLAQIDGRRRSPGSDGDPVRLQRVHIVGDLRPRRRDRIAARALARVLTPHADVRLWSTLPAGEVLARNGPVPTIDAASAAGFAADTVVVLEADDFPGDWFDALRAQRLVLRMRAADPERLVQRLAHVEANPALRDVAVAVPGRDAAARLGPAAILEYAWIDDGLLDTPGACRNSVDGLVIGRHGADPAAEHHPGDPALYRRLMNAGHRIRILGGGALVPAFAGDPAVANITLLASHDEAPGEFLDTLDVYLYRRAMAAAGDGGARVLEAMAAARPVVVFASALDVPECIDDGRTGFVVASEDDAFNCIERLAADPALRHSMGAAAREAAAALMTAQRYRVTASYLGPERPPPA